MTLDELLAEERAIWGDLVLSPDEAVVVLAKVVGDLAALARKHRELAAWSQSDVADWVRELGNLVATSVRLIHDQGVYPNAAVRAALSAQARYAVFGKATT